MFHYVQKAYLKHTQSKGDKYHPQKDFEAESISLENVEVEQGGRLRGKKR